MSILNFYLYLTFLLIHIISFITLSLNLNFEIPTDMIFSGLIFVDLFAYIIYSLFKLMNNLYPNSSLCLGGNFLVLFFIWLLQLYYCLFSFISNYYSYFMVQIEKKNRNRHNLLLDFFTATFCHQIFYFLFLGPTSPSGVHV